MRPYLLRISLCLVPVLAAFGAIWYAYAHDRFKLGVDLSGGTILVYELDLRKIQASEDGKDRRESPQEMANRLAEALKRRLDPNDLYNIVIRPAGEGRVEIVLPTGGPERAKKADREWAQLLRDMEETEYALPKGKLDVNRGRIQELAERIQQITSESAWSEHLFPSKSDALKALGGKADKDLPPLRRVRARETVLVTAESTVSAGAASLLAGPVPGLTLAAAGERMNVPLALRPYTAETLPQLIKDVKKRIDDFSKEREVDSWFKQQAWHALVEKMFQKWPSLAEVEKQALTLAKTDEEKKQAPFANIAPDSFDELIGRAEVKGASIAQAFLNALQPMLGDKIITATGEKGRFLDRTEVAKFVRENYGYSLKSIEDKIDKSNKASGRGKDLTVEEVQRIKELVSKVGSLEFRILANNHDDKQAIDDARTMVNSVAWKSKLEENQSKGLPPPPPTTDGSPTGKAKVYELTTLPRGYKSKVSYAWIELGPQERQTLKLNNNAKNEAGQGFTWYEMQQHLGQALQLPLSQDRKQLQLQGALFYGRRCEDRNLPEEERRKKQFEYFVLARNPEIDPDTGEPTPKIEGKYLSTAASQAAEGRPAVSFTFNNTGAALFRDLTKKNVPSGSGDETSQIKRFLAIVLDGLIVSAPTINSEIGAHGQISGNFTAKEVDALVNILRSGSLPATLKTQPVSESTLGATLGQDTIEKGVGAIAYSFLAVMAFMIVYYRFAGVVASTALLANLILTVGFMVAVSATFTLPGLAGLVLMVGMAVDANVLIYERLREERERGASLLLALRNGYDRAFPTIIDTHLTSILTAVVLYVVGNDQLKGFGVSLTVGLIISLFTSLYMTRLIFDIWEHMGWLKKLSMFRLFSKPDIDFMGIRYYWFAATIVLTILGMGLFVGRLPDDLNIDFVGGTAYAGQLNQGKNIQELRPLLDEEQQQKMLKAEVKELPAGGENRYEIKYELPGGGFTDRRVNLANKPEGKTPEERAKVVQKRAEVLPDLSVEQIFSAKDVEGGGKSRYFSVRTSEKEPELVQATLDQLLQEKKDGRWESLLKKVRMEYDRLPPGGRETRLRFYEAQGTERHFASPSFVRTLLNRELLAQYRALAEKDAKAGEKAREYREMNELPFHLDITGEGPTDQGRFEVMKLTFSPGSGSSGLSAGDIEAINRALENTKEEFQNRPQPERLENFDSQLAAETRLRAMYAILLSWGAIMVYLWFRFGNWTFGLAAVLCLIHDLFFTLGIIAACHYLHGTWLGNLLLIEDFKIDLTAVAALLTLVGYSVNDTIVVFDRIREVRGKNPDLTPQMINDSVNQTLSRTILTSLVTWLVVIVLYIWGGPGVHLFAFVMVVGVIVGTYSSIYIASPLLLIFGEGARSVRSGPQPRQPVVTGIQPAR